MQCVAADKVIMKTKLITTALIIVLVITALTCTVGAAGTPAITVSSTSGNPGDTVTVKLSLENNPGVSAMILTPSYDSTALQLDSVKGSDDFGGMVEYVNRIVWLSSGGDVQQDGDFLTLTFTVLDSARKGDLELSVTYSDGDICNWNEENVDFEIASGKVEILSDGTGTVASAAAPTSDTEVTEAIGGALAADKTETEEGALTAQETEKSPDDDKEGAVRSTVVIICVAAALALVALVCITVYSKKKDSKSEASTPSDSGKAAAEPSVSSDEKVSSDIVDGGAPESGDVSDVSGEAGTQEESDSSDTETPSDGAENSAASDRDGGSEN